jgi:hypothetical protein
MLANIRDPLGGSLGLGWLLLGGGLAGGIAIDRWRRHRFVPRPWLVPLLLFLLLFTGRWAVDSGDPQAVKAATVATTGGVLLFLAVGWAVSLAVEGMVEALRARPALVDAVLLAWIAGLAAIVALLGVEAWSVRRSIGGGSMLADIAGRYQRPGNLLIILTALAAAGTCALRSVAQRRAGVGSWGAVCALAPPLALLAIVSAVLGQMYGSNVAAVAILAIGLLALSAMVAVPIWAQRVRILAIGRRLLFGSVALLLPLAAIGVAALLLLAIDPSRLRITGFGTGRVRSLESRLDLWSNFPTHFADSPLLGNMLVDAETTGQGTYVHSFAAMLLTHTGVVGFLLFATAVVLAIASLLRRPAQPPLLEPPGRGRAEGIVAAGLLVVVLGIAALGTAITWAPAWFVLGLAAPPLIFEPRRCAVFTMLPAVSMR